MGSSRGTSLQQQALGKAKAQKAQEAQLQAEQAQLLAEQKQKKEAAFAEQIRRRKLSGGLLSQVGAPSNETLG